VSSRHAAAGGARSIAEQGVAAIHQANQCIERWFAVVGIFQVKSSLGSGN